MIVRLRQALFGAVEIPLLMASGALRFGGRLPDVATSFVVPLALVVPTALLSSQNPEVKDFDLLRQSAEFVLNYGLALSLFSAFLLAIFWGSERRYHVLRFVVGTNWLALCPFVFEVVLSLISHLSGLGWEQFNVLRLLFSYYVYGYQAVLLSGVFSLRWYIAIGLSLIGMAIDFLIHMALFS